MFRPMALTVIFALAGSLVLSLTLMPVMASLALSDHAKEKDIWLIHWIKRLYAPVLDLFVHHPFIAVFMAAGLVITSVPIAWNMGAEFMPRLNEGDLLIEAVRIPSASLEAAVPMSTQIETLLKTIPEVRLVYCKTGRPEIANDVMGVHQTDVWTLLKSQDEWRPGLTREDLIEEMDKLLSERVPGVKFGFSQPIEMRVNELVAGVKSDVAVLIYGPELDVLRQLAAEVVQVVSHIPGARDIKVPSAGRLPMLRLRVRRDQLRGMGSRLPTSSPPSPPWVAPRWVPCSRARSDTHCRFACRFRGAMIPTGSVRSALSTPRADPSRSRISRTLHSKKDQARSNARTSSAGSTSA